MTALRQGRARLAAACCGLALLASACVDPDLEVLDAGAGEPLATTSTIVRGEDTLAVGEATATARGNSVAVLDAAASADRLHTLIEACAGPDATEEVGVSLSFFRLQLRGGSLLEPMDPRDAREPALRTHQLDPGTCTVGWLSFEAEAAPALVFASSSSTTRWELDDVEAGA